MSLQKKAMETYGAIKMKLNGKDRLVSPMHFIGNITVLKLELKRGRARGTFFQHITEIHPKWGERMCVPFPDIPEPADPEYVPPYDPFGSGRPNREKYVDPEGIMYLWGYAAVMSKHGWVQLECIGYKWHWDFKGVDLQCKILDCVGDRKLIGKVTRIGGRLTAESEKKNIWGRIYCAFGINVSG